MAAAAFVVTIAAWFLLASAPRGWTAPDDCTLTSTSGTVRRLAGHRPYYLNVPGGLPRPAAPLLFALHGFTQLPRDHEAVTGWDHIAAARHFIVAYPGTQPSRSAW